MGRLSPVPSELQNTQSSQCDSPREWEHSSFWQEMYGNLKKSEFWLLVACAYACMLGQGFIDNTRSVTYPLMKEDLHLSYTQFGGLRIRVALFRESALECMLFVESPAGGTGALLQNG